MNELLCNDNLKTAYNKQERKKIKDTLTHKHKSSQAIITIFPLKTSISNIYTKSCNILYILCKHIYAGMFFIWELNLFYNFTPQMEKQNVIFVVQTLQTL